MSLGTTFGELLVFHDQLKLDSIKTSNVIAIMEGKSESNRMEVNATLI